MAENPSFKIKNYLVFHDFVLHVSANPADANGVNIQDRIRTLGTLAAEIDKFVKDNRVDPNWTHGASEGSHVFEILGANEDKIVELNVQSNADSAMFTLPHEELLRDSLVADDKPYPLPEFYAEFFNANGQIVDNTTLKDELRRKRIAEYVMQLCH